MPLVRKTCLLSGSVCYVLPTYCVLWFQCIQTNLELLFLGVDLKLFISKEVCHERSPTRYVFLVILIAEIQKVFFFLSAVSIERFFYFKQLFLYGTLIWWVTYVCFFMLSYHISASYSQQPLEQSDC